MDRDGLIVRALKRFPEGVLGEFLKVQPQMAQSLPPGDYAAWAREGVSLAEHSFRSWEAAAEYFRVSPRVLDRLPFPDFLTWVRWGRLLAEDSPVLASVYFKVGPQVLEHLGPRELEDWVAMGRRLYKGTWKSGALASRFFEVSPPLLDFLPVEELHPLLLFLETLAQKSCEVATQCLSLTPEVLSGLDSNLRERLLRLVTVVAEVGWSDAKACLEAIPRTLGRIEAKEKGHFLDLAIKIAGLEGHKVLSFLTDGSRALQQIDGAQHHQALFLFDKLLEQSPTAALEFLKSSPRVLSRIRSHQLNLWFDEGLRLLQENPEGGLAYFRLESHLGEDILERLASGVELSRVREILRLYCKALAAKEVDIKKAQELVERGIGWTSPMKSTTDGSTIFLPTIVDRYEVKAGNFAWLKVLVTHQVGHLEFGSFGFDFQREAPLFANLRSTLVPQTGQERETEAVIDLERFFDLFPDRQLASHIFTAVEDARVDYKLLKEYAGIRSIYHKIQQDALSHRPVLTSLPLREAFVEALIQLSLGNSQGLKAPKPLRPHLKAMTELIHRVQCPEATVEDSAEVTVRLYEVLSQLPNDRVPAEDWEETEEEQQEGESTELPAEFSPSQSRSDESPYQPPQEVEFRGEFKPELVQLLLKLMEAQGREIKTPPIPISQETLKQLAEKSTEIEAKNLDQADLPQTTGLFISNLMDWASQQTTQGTEDRRSSAYAQGNALEREPLTCLYDEWDFRASAYKPNWCRVRERRLEEGLPTFFEETMRNYSVMASQVKRQFELLAPELMRKVRRLPDGEDLELDAVVESVVDRKAKASPSDKLYWKRNKVQRDVAVAFLLDMSASTAEAIEEVRRSSYDYDLLTDPRYYNSYISWLRSRQQETGRRTYKRIIDVEKETAVLLIHALETIGDTYGIYGFSGYGRENIEFFVIKDLDEAFSDKVKRRIDKIAPWHATRMGPAIRHAIAKLERQESHTRILFLISDGRPQDHGYSRDGVEKEYAIHDTHMALHEAKCKNITPFCLTVDRMGHDYLKSMCQDLPYEVLPNIESLPRRLPLLYRRLTA